jgi:parallel beta-helix repeat protein
MFLDKKAFSFVLTNVLLVLMIGNRKATLLLILCFILVNIPKVRVVNAWAQTIVVPDDYSTIQAAIDNAPEGGTVFVRSGSYHERVLVNKPLSLIGEDPENTEISVQLHVDWSYGAIEVLADNVTISGFTIKDAWYGIWIQYSRCRIIGNNIVNNYRHGILMGGENHVVSGNYITGNGASGIDIQISSNQIINGNNITGNGAEGIRICSSENVTISNNNISNNSRGLALRWDGPFYVYGNNITDNQRYGIQFDGCSDSIIYQNNIEHNSIGVLINLGIYGTAYLGSGNAVYRNNIVDNSQQASVDKELDSAGMSPERSNGTDIVSWDNGTVGNYWNDYQTRYPHAAEVGTSGIGDTPYVIYENNTDYHPLMQPLNISLTLSPLSESSSNLLLTIAAIVVAVVIIFAVAVFVYRAHRKGKQAALLT